MPRGLTARFPYSKREAAASSSTRPPQARRGASEAPPGRTAVGVLALLDAPPGISRGAASAARERRMRPDSERRSAGAPASSTLVVREVPGLTPLA